MPRNATPRTPQEIQADLAVAIEFAQAKAEALANALRKAVKHLRALAKTQKPAA